MSEFIFYVPSAAKFIWRRAMALRVSSNRQEEAEIKLGTPGYKVSV